MEMPGLKTFLRGMDKAVLKEFFMAEASLTSKSIDWNLLVQELLTQYSKGKRM